MRKLGSFIFGLVFFTLIFFQFRQVIIVAHFLIYQDQIIEAHCENKNEPELACNGSCHLKTELVAAIEIEPQKSSLPEAPNCSPFLFYAMSFTESTYIKQNILEFFNTIFFHYQPHFSSKHLAKVESPPEFLS